MQYLKKFRWAISMCLLMAGLTLVLNWQSHLPGVYAADALQFDVSALVHGFATAPGLPEGDVFLLPKPLKLTIQHPPESAALFTVSAESFGGEAQTMGGLPAVPAHGFSVSAPGETARALLSAESIWQGNFFLAANAGAAGDTVRVFVQLGDGTGVQELLNFTAEAEGFRLNDIHAHLKLFVDNRFALGPDTKRGALLPFVDEAGPRGQRTGMLTFAFPLDFASPLQGCLQLGVELNRAQGEGMSSVVIADLLVKRNKVAGDEDNPAVGRRGKLTGGYPSGLPCKTAHAVAIAQPGMWKASGTATVWSLLR